MVAKLEKFQRDAMLAMVGRTYRDRICNVDIYEWLHARNVYLYPMRLTIMERKVRYFSQVVRLGLGREHPDVASMLYWSDLAHPCAANAFEYEHIHDMKAALAELGITEVEANAEFHLKSRLERKLKQCRADRYREWKELEIQAKEERRLNRINSGEAARELEAEKQKNGGWYHKPKPLPI